MIKKIEKGLNELIIKNSRREITEDDIKNNSNLIKDFGYDSIMLVQLIVDIEDKFEICIDDDDVELDLLVNYNELKAMLLNKLDLQLYIVQ